MGWDGGWDGREDEGRARVRGRRRRRAAVECLCEWGVMMGGFE